MLCNHVSSMITISEKLLTKFTYFNFLPRFVDSIHSIKKGLLLNLIIFVLRRPSISRSQKPIPSCDSIHSRSNPQRASTRAVAVIQLLQTQLGIWGSGFVKCPKSKWSAKKHDVDTLYHSRVAAIPLVCGLKCWLCLWSCQSAPPEPEQQFYQDIKQRVLYQLMPVFATMHTYHTGAYRETQKWGWGLGRDWGGGANVEKNILFLWNP